MPTPPPELTLREHFDWVVDNEPRSRWLPRGFHAQLLRHFRHHVPEGSRVLERAAGPATCSRG